MRGEGELLPQYPHKSASRLITGRASRRTIDRPPPAFISQLRQPQRRAFQIQRAARPHWFVARVELQLRRRARCRSHCCACEESVGKCRGCAACGQACARWAGDARRATVVCERSAAKASDWARDPARFLESFSGRARKSWQSCVGVGGGGDKAKRAWCGGGRRRDWQG